MHRGWTMGVSIAAVGAVLCASAPSLAQTGQAGAPQEQAAAAFDQGMALFDNENWAGALAAFQRAYDLAPHYVVLFNIGQCHRFLGEYPEAIETLERYLREGGEQVAAQKRAEVAATLIELRSFVAMVTVSVDVAGAEVLVDGQPRGRSPLPGPLALGAGDHVIGARGEGNARAETRLRLAGGESRTVELRLAGGQESPAPAPAVELRLAGEQESPAATPTVATTSAEEAEGLSQVWFWTSAGLAGALAIGGAITGGLVLSAGSDYDDATARCAEGHPQACADGPGIKSDGETYQLVTNILFPAAGAAAAAAFVLFLFTEFGGDDEAPPVTAGVTAGDGALGVSASWAF